MVIVLFVAIIILSIFVVSLIHSHLEMKQQLEAFDREQHNQNMDMIRLMKEKAKHDEMLLQHIEILKYLVEQDPKLNSNRIYFTGPIGEA